MIDVLTVALLWVVYLHVLSNNSSDSLDPSNAPAGSYLPTEHHNSCLPSLLGVRMQYPHSISPDGHMHYSVSFGS